MHLVWQQPLKSDFVLKKVNGTNFTKIDLFKGFRGSEVTLAIFLANGYFSLYYIRVSHMGAFGVTRSLIKSIEQVLPKSNF